MNKFRTATPEEAIEIEQGLADAFDLLKLPSVSVEKAAEMEEFEEEHPEWVAVFKDIKIGMISVLHIYGEVAAANWLVKRIRGGSSVTVPEGDAAELYERYRKMMESNSEN